MPATQLCELEWIEEIAGVSASPDGRETLHDSWQPVSRGGQRSCRDRSAADNSGCGRSIGAVAITLMWLCLLPVATQGADPIELKGHGEAVYDAAFLPDGRTVVTASFDRTLRLWDAASGQPTRTMEGHTGIVLCVSVSPDGSLIASGAGDNTIKLWDVPQNEPVQTLAAHDGPGRSVAVSADGTLLATADEQGVIRIRATATGEKTQEVSVGAVVTRLAWRRDQKQLAAATTDGRLIVIEPADGSLIAVIGAHAGEVTGLEFAPNNTRIYTAGADGIVRHWPTTFTPVVVGTGHDGAIHAVAQHPGGSLIVTAGQDKTVRIWNRADGSQVRTLDGHMEPVKAVAFSANGSQIVTGGDDRIARLFDSGSGNLVREFPPLEKPVTAVSLHPSGQQIVVADQAGAIKWFNVADGAELRTDNAGAAVTGLAMWSNGARLLTSAGRKVQLVDAASGNVIKTHEFADVDVTAVALAANNALAAIGLSDGSIHVLNPESGESTAVLKGHAGAVTGLQFNTNNTQLLSSSADGTARLWDMATALPLQQFVEHAGAVTGVSFQRDNRSTITVGVDGKLRADTVSSQLQHVADENRINDLALAVNGSQIVTAGADGSVKVWNASNGSPLRSMTGFQGPVLCVTGSANNQQIAAGGEDGTLRTWNASNGSPYFTIQVGAAVGRVSYSPDSSKLAAVTAQREIRCFDPTPLNPQPADPPHRDAAQILSGHTDDVVDLSWSPDSRGLRSISRDKSVLEWSVAAAGVTANLTGHSSQIYSVAFSPDGKLLASGSNDKTIRLWDLETKKQLRATPAQPAAIYSIAFSPDGQQLAVAGADQSVRLLAVSNLTETRRYEGPEYAVYTLAFSPDGSQIAAAGMGLGAERSVFVWDTSSSAPSRVMTGHPDDIYRVSFSPSGSKLLSLGYSGQFRIWDHNAGNAVFSSDLGHVAYGARYSTDGQRIIIASGDRTARILDVPENAR